MPQKETGRRNLDMRGFVLSLAAFILTAVTLPNAKVAMGCTIACLFFAVDFAFTFSWARNFYTWQRISTAIVVVSVLSAGVWFGWLRGQYREQQAALIEGDLVPDDESGSEAYAQIEIGSTGTVFNLLPGAKGEFSPLATIVYRSGLRVEKGPNGILLTTPIKDRDGHLIASITQNHWHVYGPYCSDKNYSKNSLEVLDASGEVVFQAVLSGSVARLQGIWRDQDGNGVELVQTDQSEGPAEMLFWTNRDTEKKIERLIKPIFIYPASSHWEEVVPKQP